MFKSFNVFSSKVPTSGGFGGGAGQSAGGYLSRGTNQAYSPSASQWTPNTNTGSFFGNAINSIFGSPTSSTSYALPSGNTSNSTGSAGSASIGGLNRPSYFGTAPSQFLDPQFGFTAKGGTKKKITQFSVFNKMEGIQRRRKEDKENLPTSGPLVSKNISGPDFQMSKHSADTKSGTIKTSEGTFGVESGDADRKMQAEIADKDSEKRTTEILKEQKSRYAAEAADRYAKAHPKQKIKKLSKSALLGKQIFGGITSMGMGGMGSAFGGGGSNPGAGVYGSFMKAYSGQYGKYI